MTNKLGIIRYVGPLQMPIEETIRTNGVAECLHCGCEITEQNDSGWEMFTNDGVTTQPVCKECDAGMNISREKAISGIEAG